jgi:hypothetical protein
MNKYCYMRVIQEATAYGWEDSSAYETDSSYCFRSQKDRQAYKNDVKAYREAGVVIRSVNRKELP